MVLGVDLGLARDCGLLVRVGSLLVASTCEAGQHQVVEPYPDHAAFAGFATFISKFRSTKPIVTHRSWTSSIRTMGVSPIPFPSHCRLRLNHSFVSCHPCFILYEMCDYR